MTTHAEADSVTALPDGWQAVEHERFGTCWISKATRVVLWSRPYALDSDLDTAEAHEMPSEATSDALMQALAEQHARASLGDADAALREQQPGLCQEQRKRSRELAEGDEIAQDLMRWPAVRYDAVLPKIEESLASTRHEHRLARVPQIFLRKYADAVLCAHVHSEVDVPTDGPWLQPPPYRCGVHILGVRVSEALHSVEDTARAIAYEAACLRLCPLLYREGLRRLNMRQPPLLRPTITDVGVPARLAVDDEQVLNLDRCVAKTPAEMVQEHLLRQYGHTKLQVQTVPAVRPVPAGGSSSSRLTHGHESTLTLGGRVFVAFDAVPRRARQRASIALLQSAHPEIRTWQQMMDLYSSSPQAMASRSQVAEALLQADRLTVVSQSMKAKDRKLAERAVPAPTLLRHALDPTVLSATAVGRESEGGARLVPGAGHNFAYNWQRQVRPLPQPAVGRYTRAHAHPQPSRRATAWHTPR